MTSLEEAEENLRIALSRLTRAKWHLEKTWMENDAELDVLCHRLSKLNVVNNTLNRGLYYL
jgi:hypothetical protein